MATADVMDDGLPQACSEVRRRRFDGVPVPRQNL